MGVCAWLFASMYDRVTAGVEAAGLAARREQLLKQAHGRVLEIGAGTGANLRFYPPSVDPIVCLEPEAPMVSRLARRACEHPRHAGIVQGAAETLPFADAQFDTVVSTLVLCTVVSQSRSLREIGRVLKPGGRLLFIEHVRSDSPRLAAWQDRLNWLNRIVAAGCNCNRATLDVIKAAGFATDVAHGELTQAPPFLRPLIVGTAEKPLGAAVVVAR